MTVKPLDLKNQTLVTVKADVCDGDGVALVTLEQTDYKLLVAQLTILYDIYGQRYDMEKLTKKEIDKHFYDNFTAYLNQYVELPEEDILFTIHDALAGFIPTAPIDGFWATRIYQIVVAHENKIGEIAKPDEDERLELIQELIKYGELLQ